MKVEGLAQEYNTVSPARTRTQPARSRDECTNHEANASPHCPEGGLILYDVERIGENIMPAWLL